MGAIYILGLAVLELLVEVVQYTTTGQHNSLAIAYAITFSSIAIILVLFYYYDGKE